MKRAIRTILAVFFIIIGVGKFDEVHADPMAKPGINDSEWRFAATDTALWRAEGTHGESVKAPER